MLGMGRAVIAAGAIGALLATGLTTATATAVDDGPRTGQARLAADASGALSVRAGFVGVPSGARVDNPDVDRRTSVVAAARSHLQRYGAVVGADRAGTAYAVAGQDRTVAGRTVVRFGQRVDGLPVIGGEVVVSLRDDRELGSMLSTGSSTSGVPAASVPQAKARAVALGIVTRVTRATGLAAVGSGRAVFDPAVFGVPSTLGARGVWRFEVTDGGLHRHLVLVDDQTGAVLLDLDQNQGVDRVVCDNGNVQRGSDRACTSGFARTESGGASGNADVDAAFDLSGEVAQMYAEVGGLDLTQMLGLSVGGARKLASTVRWCYSGEDCPYENAFWNGSQMYYGDGYAGADDVVGHEMTHGVIDQYSQLFYWGQSGAINESLADIMGEILDHRFVSAGDSASSWTMGEDLPIGAIRDLKDPTRFDQPDRMTSPRYTADLADLYPDNGGVHTNSGVGNKTAYLISQGGTFNGQTITGIDGGDGKLTKTAILYLDAIQSLSSGSDYADLANVLEQSCADLVGTHGFTASDCAAVHKAVGATELRTTPTAARQPADAALACPSGVEPQVLFDSESGSASSKLTGRGGWTRSVSRWGSNATSGTDSWSNTGTFSGAQTIPTTQSLTTTAGITIPNDGATYLWFQGWHLFDYGTVEGQSGLKFFDGGTVEIVADGRADDAASLPWVNGPDRTLFSGTHNPAAGRRAFGGDSSGWVASRVDLSSYAGRTIQPQFSVNYDDSWTFVGWYLDDVTVYSCGAPDRLVNTVAPRITGKARVGKTLTAAPGDWTPAGSAFGYQWLRQGKAIRGATRVTYRLVGKDRGKRISVRVTAHHGDLSPVAVTSKATKAVKRRR